MKKKLQPVKAALWLWLLLIAPTLYAQFDDGLWTGMEAYNWCYGFNQGISFTSGGPQILAGAQTSVMEGSAAISDANGQLLFYAANGTVWNKNHAIMLNGNNLLSDDQSSTQSGIIIPKPGTPGIYYLFNIDMYDGLVYSEIDMSLDNGLGGVTVNKNIVLESNARVEKITAVYHQDKERVWVISHLSGSNQFVAYLISAAGIATPVISAVGINYPTAGPTNPEYQLAGPGGQLKASPDGSKLASVKQGEIVGFSVANGSVEVFDFDNATGLVSNPISLQVTHALYTAEFSPNSKLLYLMDDLYLPTSGALGTTIENIFQYNLEAGNQAAVVASATNIAQYFSRYNSAFQLGPDGRMYFMNTAGLNQLMAINNPNNLGAAAGYQTGVLTLGDGDSLAFPSFNQSYFQSGILYQETCNNAVTFTALRIPDITLIAWNFGDPDSGANNTSSLAYHVFSAPGTYNVTAQVTSNGAVQTVSLQVVVSGLGPAVAIPQNLSNCSNSAGVASFNLSAQTATILNGLNPSDYTVAYFTTQADAQNGTNAITNVAAFQSTGQTIYVNISGTNNNCSSIIVFTLIAVPAPVLPTLPNLQLCGTTSAVFNLTAQNAVLLQSQPGATITYYTTQADADAATNAIATPQSFTNTTSPQTIFVRVDVAGGGCYAVTQFTLQVTPAPAPPQAPNLSACDTGTQDGFTTFNLSQQDAIVLQGQPAATVAYYTSQANADAATNAIGNIQNFSNTANPQTIYARVGNGSCYAITTFALNVIAAPVLADLQIIGCQPFNLTEAVTNTTGLQYTYYASEADAEASTNAISSPQSYTGTEAYVRAQNAEGCFAIAPIVITAAGCDIQKGISPNGDDMNDNFDLTYLKVQKLSIYNRYGMQVYNKGNYTNQWYGQTNDNRELPTGTYYYVIEPENGNSKTGWIYINRQIN